MPYVCAAHGLLWTIPSTSNDRFAVKLIESSRVFPEFRPGYGSCIVACLHVIEARKPQTVTRMAVDEGIGRKFPADHDFF